MTNYHPQFSPEYFFENGSSLWRWIKYGHGKSTPYVNPFSKISLTMPCAPHINNRIINLMTDPSKLPDVFNERATNFFNASRNFPAIPNTVYNYPGDGYILFMDPLFIKYKYPRHTDPIVFKFYNFLYSYRDRISPAMFNYLSNLKDNINKIQIFYEHRVIIFKDIFYFGEINKYFLDEYSIAKIEQEILARIFGHSLDIYARRLNISISVLMQNIFTLFEGFTYTAVKRILFNQDVTQHSITRAVNLVRDTCRLINRLLPQKYTSIAELQRFHDSETERLINLSMKMHPHFYIEYAWSRELVNLVNEISEGKWYIPVRPSELKLRGKSHKNCVGGYIDRHFAKPIVDSNDKTSHKLLILLSDEAEAEIYLYFKTETKKNKDSLNDAPEKRVCYSSKLVQCKTKFNKVYPSDIPVLLCKAFVGCDIRYFEPLVLK